MDEIHDDFVRVLDANGKNTRAAEIFSVLFGMLLVLENIFMLFFVWKNDS